MTTSAPPAPKKQRGRETAGDMIRSLGLILIFVVTLWWLAQPPDSDEAAIRVVDPSRDVAALQQRAPGVPVPRGLPPQWRPTSSTLEPSGLRIGYVTPLDQYAEYAVSDRPEFLGDITGQGREVGAQQIGGETWRQYVDGEDHTTLVRSVAGRTVIVGGLRESTTLDELRTLAGSLS